MMSSGSVEYLHIRLRDELDRLKLSLAEAARRIGESDPQGLRDVIGGRKRLSAELLARLIGVGIDAVFILTGVRSGATPVQPENPRERILLEKYRAVPPDVQDATQTLLDAAAKSDVKKGKAA